MQESKYNTDFLLETSISLTMIHIVGYLQGCQYLVLFLQIGQRKQSDYIVRGSVNAQLISLDFNQDAIYQYMGAIKNLIIKTVFHHDPILLYRVHWEMLKNALHYFKSAPNLFTTK